MIDTLSLLLFGWPAIILSIILALTGLVRRWTGLLILAAIISLPFFWFLSQTPRFGKDGFLIPLLLLASAYALAQNRRRIAVLLTLPYAIFIIWLAAVVLSSN